MSRGFSRQSPARLIIQELWNRKNLVVIDGAFGWRSASSAAVQAPTLTGFSR